MQTILGAGGAIGSELAKALGQQYTQKIRLVSRNPKKVNPTDELFAADLSNPADVDAAVAGSEVVYVTIGFEYKLSVWREKWPAFMRSVIDACAKHKAKLVFFDNVYMYDSAEIPHMTEESKMNPPSEKGKVRKQVIDMIFEAIKAKKINALIARSADFYGPGIGTSMLQETVSKNLQKDKAAQWIGGMDFKHSATYTPDAARATALLGNTPDAYDQVWHLPTYPDAPTGREWTELFAKEMNKKAKVSAIPKFMLKILGWFIPILGEVYEMTYQFEQPYFFDSAKFMKRFPDFKTTSYAEGIKEIVARG
ncbi:NAD-dependent dehydratase [Runella rosea]|uniref:NAD-dependent dehydratase n=1 Tax=Runella rosea TaxID=2259595 RepID=A0A344TPA2_9BACT|nr:NAD-dependent epimerase/dehydratase family protein [Runella rosea]AXE20473.1 NAD-dependent dehydratase [Runella rosea]